MAASLTSAHSGFDPFEENVNSFYGLGKNHLLCATAAELKLINLLVTSECVFLSMAGVLM